MTPPTIRTLTPADAEALERFLAARWASSMFLLGNLELAGLADEGARLQGSYSAAFVDGAMAGVAAHYRNGNLVLQAPRFAAVLAAHAARASGRPVAGLLGPADQVAAAALALGLTDASYDGPQRLYTLELGALRVPEALAAGRVRARRAAASDLDALVSWRAAYEVETMAREDSPQLRAGARAALERGLAEERLWLLEEGERRVATSAVNARTGAALQIGGVWTPPELRGRGYARAAVAGTLLAERAAGATEAVLFTRLDNVAAQRAYRALGFRPVGFYRVLLR